MFSKKQPIAFAENQNADDVKQVEIVSTLNSNRQKNKSLIKKGTSEFYDVYNYFPKTSSSGKNLNMILSINSVSFEQSDSFFMWMFIPSILLSDLVVSVEDGIGNSLVWKVEGTEDSSENDFNLMFSDMFKNYGSQITRGWKLVEFSRNDAQNKGNQISEIRSISITYSFLNMADQADNAEFEIGYCYVSNGLNLQSQIISHQEYVVYADKNSFLETTKNLYVGDKIEIKKASDFFSYVVVGKQNILDNSSGYVWNITLSEPSGGAKNLTLDRKLEILFEEVGYYVLDISLTTSDQDYYSLISENFNIYIENFAFGYFFYRNSQLLR